VTRTGNFREIDKAVRTAEAGFGVNFDGKTN
jgi:hypothetical protein